MIDVAEANARDVDISLDTIADEVKAGLPLHADRLVEAFDNEEYYAGRNAAYIARREAEDWRDYLRRPRRTSKILRKVIRALARLYAPGRIARSRATPRPTNSSTTSIRPITSTT
jgi:hypothetical protein